MYLSDILHRGVFCFFVCVCVFLLNPHGTGVHLPLGSLKMCLEF